MSKRGKMEQIVEQISELMLKRLNKDISFFEHYFILQSIEERIKILELETFYDYFEYFKIVHDEAIRLDEILNNMFTQFFRDRLTCSILEKYILPEIINRKNERNEIRIWSAGCSTGQEAYSIAIMLKELLKMNEECRFLVLATDYTDSALKIAESAIYSRESMLNVRLDIIDKYFIKTDEKYSVASFIKDLVVFSKYDLLDRITYTPPESIFGDFDIIICSNVLYYYNKDSRDFIINKLQKALSSNGYLITGDAESMFIKGTKKLLPLNIPTSIYQKKVR